MTWYTLEEKEPPKNTSVLLICRMGEKRYGREVYDCTVGKYSTGLEWWDIPWTQAEPVLWAQIDTHPAWEKLDAMERQKERENANL